MLGLSRFEVLSKVSLGYTLPHSGLLVAGSAWAPRCQYAGPALSNMHKNVDLTADEGRCHPKADGHTCSGWQLRRGRLVAATADTASEADYRLLHIQRLFGPPPVRPSSPSLRHPRPSCSRSLWAD